MGVKEIGSQQWLIRYPAFPFYALHKSSSCSCCCRYIQHISSSQLIIYLHSIISHISISTISTISALLPIQLAKGLERRETLALTLKHHLRRCPNEEHKPLTHFFRLWPDTNLATALRTNEDTWAIDSFKRSFRALTIELGLDDGKLFDGRVIEYCAGRRGVGGAVESNVWVVDGLHLLLGDRGVGVG